MANYKELYDLAVQLHFEEKSRFNRIDQKASWYFSGLTLLLGITAFFSKWMIDSLLPPKDALDVILLLIGLLLCGAVCLSWFLIFRVLRVASVVNIPLSAQTISIYSENNDPTIYWVMTQSIRSMRDANIRVTDEKSKVLCDAYRVMMFSLIVIGFFGFLYAGRTSIDKNQIKLKERTITTMCEKENEPAEQDQSAEQTPVPDPVSEKPDTSVPLLPGQILTEGYDPGMTKTGEKKQE